MSLNGGLNYLMHKLRVTEDLSERGLNVKRGGRSVFVDVFFNQNKTLC